MVQCFFTSFILVRNIAAFSVVLTLFLVNSNTHNENK